MSQYVPTASALAQHNGGIGALGDMTFVSEVIIVERSDYREFLTLRGESLGLVQRNDFVSKEVACAVKKGPQQENDQQ